MVSPVVKASIVASTMDLKGQPVLLTMPLTKAIIKVAAITVAGTITQGRSFINIKIEFIFTMPISCFSELI